MPHAQSDTIAAIIRRYAADADAPASLGEAVALLALARARKRHRLTHEAIYGLVQRVLRASGEDPEKLPRADLYPRIGWWLRGNFDCGLLPLHLPVLLDADVRRIMGDVVRVAASRDAVRAMPFAVAACNGSAGVTYDAVRTLVGSHVNVVKRIVERVSRDGQDPILRRSPLGKRPVRLDTDAVIRRVWGNNRSHDGWRLSRRTDRETPQQRESRALWRLLLYGTVDVPSGSPALPGAIIPMPPSLRLVLERFRPQGVRLLRGHLLARISDDNRIRRGRYVDDTPDLQALCSRWRMYFWALESYGTDCGKLLERLLLPGHLFCPQCGTCGDPLGYSPRTGNPGPAPKAEREREENIREYLRIFLALLATARSEDDDESDKDEDEGIDSSALAAELGISTEEVCETVPEEDAGPVAHHLWCPHCRKSFPASKDRSGSGDRLAWFRRAMDAAPHASTLSPALLDWLRTGARLLDSLPGTQAARRSCGERMFMVTEDDYDVFCMVFRNRSGTGTYRLGEVTPADIAKGLREDRSWTWHRLQHTYRHLAENVSIRDPVNAAAAGRLLFGSVAEFLWHIRLLMDHITPEIGYVFPSAVTDLVEHFFWADTRHALEIDDDVREAERLASLFAPTQKELELLCAHLGVSGLQHCCESVAEAKGMPCPARCPQGPASPPSAHGSTGSRCKDARNQRLGRGRPGEGDGHKKRAPRAS